jgi:hypothetical protein
MLLDTLNSAKIADVSAVLEAVAEDESMDTITDNNNSQQQCDVLIEKVSCKYLVILV